MSTAAPHDLITSVSRTDTQAQGPRVYQPAHNNSTSSCSQELYQTPSATSRSRQLQREAEISLNHGRPSPIGIIASGPYYNGADTALLPPEPRHGWLLPHTPSGRRKCLVLDLDETLVHSSFNPVSGADMVIPIELDGAVYNVYVKKRPGVDEFLKFAASLFEVVIFTASLSTYADPVLDRLDVHGVCGQRLYRESCTYAGGLFVKDMTLLGRPLSDVIIVDNSPNSYRFQPDNAIGILSWFDDRGDRELEQLVPVLEKLARVDDVTQHLCCATL